MQVANREAVFAERHIEQCYIQKSEGLLLTILLRMIETLCVGIFCKTELSNMCSNFVTID
jgi:hypothetical protein